MFEISDDGTPHSLKMEFIDMMSFKGRSSIAYDDLTFRSLDLAADYGLNELTPQGLRHFRHFLEDPSNYDTAISYLISKMGYDPSDPDEAEYALKWYVNKKLVTEDDHQIWAYLCLMHKSLSVQELSKCYEHHEQAHYIAEVASNFRQ